jgi:hypothetical protein
MTGIQNTAFCQENGTQSERTQNKFHFRKFGGLPHRRVFDSLVHLNDTDFPIASLSVALLLSKKKEGVALSNKADISS